MTTVDDRRHLPVRPQLVVAIDDEPAATTEFRMRRSQLRDAIRERTRLRSECAGAGKELSGVGIALEIDVLIADTAGAARAALLRSGESMDGDTVRYVGTVRGLASLILDVYAAEVADTVVLCPLDRAADGTSATTALVLQSVLPMVTQGARHV